VNMPSWLSHHLVEACYMTLILAKTREYRK
jgi:hypothetical protein